jgi:hypothetical protein
MDLGIFFANPKAICPRRPHFGVTVGRTLLIADLSFSAFRSHIAWVSQLSNSFLVVLLRCFAAKASWA